MKLALDPFDRSVLGIALCLAAIIAGLLLLGDHVYISDTKDRCARQLIRVFEQYALDAVTGFVTTWNPNANSYVNSLLRDGSTVYAGGSFTNIGGQPRNYIAALSIGSGSATAWI